MAEVSLRIHGQDYGVACDDGQEDRVLEVGHYVDSRVQDIARAGAASNETHLFVLTALVLADEVKDLQDQMQALRDQMAIQERDNASAPSAVDPEEEKQIIEAIDHLAGRLDTVATRLQQL